MNCTEVTEWMHRYLDKDLGREETADMYRHLDGCPACAEAFERLSLLSEQLEQLPDVKPPFSLVDSILPRLQELDAMVPAAGTESVRKDTGTQAPAAGSAGVTGTDARRQPRGRRTSSSIAFRTGIGIAAAAAFFGIVIFGMPEPMPDAQSDYVLMEQSQEKAASSMESEATADARVSTGADADGGAGVSAYNAPVEEHSNMDAPADNAAESGAPETGDNGRAAAGTPDGNQPAASPPETRNTAKASTAPTATAEPALPPVELRSSSDAPPETAPADPQAGDAPENEALDGGNPDMEFSSVMGLLPADPAGFALSAPDGVHSAEADDVHLRIYKLSGEGNTVSQELLTELPLDGELVYGSWSDDGLVFTYKVEKDGVQQEHMFVVNTASPGPSASPSASPSA